MSVDEAQVRRVAKLAKLKLTDEEVSLFAPQLSEVVGYIDALKEVKVEGVEPLTHPFEMETPLRKDEVEESLKNKDGDPKMLDVAPEVVTGGYKVPPIL